jgi:TldD protein
MTFLNSSQSSTFKPTRGSATSARPNSESTSGRLAIAQKLLLTPFGLTEAHLSRALGEITSHGVDDADLYFQYTRSEGWSLEEGIVKTGSFSIDQGVGVRAVSGEKTAFAYSDDISEASLRTWTRLQRWTARPRSSCWKKSKNWPRPKTRALFR